MDPCSADDDRQNYPMYELPVTAYDLLSWAKGNSVSFFFFDADQMNQTTNVKAPIDFARTNRYCYL